MTGKNIALNAAYRFNAGDGLGGTVAATMGNLNLGGREVGIESYNNTEYWSNILYQALEYLVNSSSGAMALSKADIEIANYQKFAADNLKSLTKLATKVNSLWAKRKEIQKERAEEREREQRRIIVKEEARVEEYDGLLDNLADDLQEKEAALRPLAKKELDAQAAEGIVKSYEEKAVLLNAEADAAQAAGDTDLAASKRAEAKEQQDKAETARVDAKLKREEADNDPDRPRMLEAKKAAEEASKKNITYTNVTVAKKALADTLKRRDPPPPADLVDFQQALIDFNQASRELNYENPTDRAATEARYNDARARMEYIFNNTKLNRTNFEGGNDEARDDYRTMKETMGKLPPKEKPTT
jgi:hypothetical protein